MSGINGRNKVWRKHSLKSEVVKQYKSVLKRKWLGEGETTTIKWVIITCRRNCCYLLEGNRKL